MIIRKVGETKNNGIKALVYGQSGSGKTFSLSTLPDLESTLILSAEAGLLSIRDIIPEADFSIISNLDDLREAFTYVNEGEGTKYKTIVLDSLTEIAQQILSYEQENTKDGRMIYGNMATRVLDLSKNFRDLVGRNVILICQEERIQDDEGRMLYGPAMPGKKVGPQLPYLTDLVFALRVKHEDDKTKRVFQTSPLFSPDYVSKDRSGKLDIIEPPDWSIVFDKINNSNER